MKFNLSINISQGVSEDFNYIVTPNAQKVYGNIVDSFQSGIHSFSIIGTYGTGKSSFLMALEQDLLNNKYNLVSGKSLSQHYYQRSCQLLLPMIAKTFLVRWQST